MLASFAPKARRRVARQHDERRADRQDRRQGRELEVHAGRDHGGHVAVLGIHTQFPVDEDARKDEVRLRDDDALGGRGRTRGEENRQRVHGVHVRIRLEGVGGVRPQVGQERDVHPGLVPGDALPHRHDVRHGIGQVGEDLSEVVHAGDQHLSLAQAYDAPQLAGCRRGIDGDRDSPHLRQGQGALHEFDAIVEVEGNAASGLNAPRNEGVGTRVDARVELTVGEAGHLGGVHVLVHEELAVCALHHLPLPQLSNCGVLWHPRRAGHSISPRRLP